MDDEREQRRRERWERRRNDPVGPIVGALILIWLGVVMLAAQNPALIRLGPFSVTWNNVWAFFLAGLGALLLLQAVLRVLIPTARRGIAGSLIWGVILLVVGLTGVLPGTGMDKLWPLALIAGGLGLLLTNLLRR